MQYTNLLLKSDHTSLPGAAKRNPEKHIISEDKFREPVYLLHYTSRHLKSGKSTASAKEVIILQALKTLLEIVC